MNTKLKLIGLLKKELFCLQKSPIFYILTAFYAVSLALRFFFANQFFSGNGSSDLRFFFSSVPYISILVLPLLTIIVSLKPFDTLTPLPSLLLLIILLILLIVCCCYRRKQKGESMVALSEKEQHTKLITPGKSSDSSSEPSLSPAFTQPDEAYPSAMSQTYNIQS